MTGQAMVVDLDGLLCGVSYKAEAHQEPFAILTVADPRGNSMSVRLTSQSARPIAEALMEAASMIKESEESYQTEQEMQLANNLDRYERYG